MYRTDPANPDTDGDGLDDGEEAGPLRQDGPVAEKTYYPLPADPTRGDTDGDDLPDSDEALTGPEPRSADTDHDGLDDFTEVDADYDPEAADADGDGMNDGVEHAQARSRTSMTWRPPRRSTPSWAGSSSARPAAAGPPSSSGSQRAWTRHYDSASEHASEKSSLEDPPDQR
ncbi:hypothetical protein ACT4S2_17150 [Kocuria turfanensis]|uniref:hypothetical protein n=1 Tax=Kocuria turfanensis TaxID=388357 RepID=UPI004036C97D